MGGVGVWQWPSAASRGSVARAGTDQIQPDGTDSVACPAAEPAGCLSFGLLPTRHIVGGKKHSSDLQKSVATNRALPSG